MSISKDNTPDWFNKTINPEGYKGTKEKYNFKLKCGHIESMLFSTFNYNKNRVCKQCAKDNTPDWFNKTINPEGYKGTKEKYNFKLKCGHIESMSLSRFSLNIDRMCNRCDENNKPEWFDKEINPEGYKGWKEKYNFRFQCGHIENTTQAIYKKYKHLGKCPSCRLTPEWFDHKINKLYNGSHQSNIYNFKMNCGHIESMMLGTYLYNKENICTQCRKKNNIPEWFSEVLNPEGYKGTKEKYNFKMKCGCIQNMYPVNYNTNRSCIECELGWFDKTLNPEGYKGNDGNTLYNFKYECGHIQKTTVERYTDNKNTCNICRSVPEWFDATINDKYNSNTDKYNFKYECGHTQTSTYSAYKGNNKLCSTCLIPKWYDDNINEEYIGSKVNYKFKCKSCSHIFETSGKSYTVNYESDCPNCKDYKVSTLEADMISFLDTLNITYNHSDWHTVKPKELDFYIPTHNLAIEMNGIYWHSESFVGKESHLDKTKMCEDKSINLLHVWESEWRDKNKREIWKSMICGKLDLNKKIGARKTIVKELVVKDAKEFLEENHLQGYAGSKYKLGLFYEDELVAVLTAGKTRYSNNNMWEIIRFASKKGINIQGGFSKLLKYFNNNFNEDKLPILSYADRRHSTGNVYKVNGFKFSHYSKPGYKYFKGYTLEPREKYMKHKLKNILKFFDESLTEYENMKKNGYDRVWDCGNSVWVLPII